jgi:hypothetical protein
MPDDDDSGKADMGFTAIEKSRSILSTHSLVFCLIETPGFVPKVQDKSVLGAFEKNTIQVEIKDEMDQVMKTIIPIEKDHTVKDIFDTLNRKNRKVFQSPNQ